MYKEKGVDYNKFMLFVIIAVLIIQLIPFTAANAATAGDFTVVTEGVSPTDYEFFLGVLYIYTEKAITVSNTGVTSHRIEVISPSAAGANITLARVNIKPNGLYSPLSVSRKSNASASTVNVNLTLKNANTLDSANSSARAGLELLDTKTNLIINGTDSDTLTVKSGKNGAGIGSGYERECGNIIINGGYIQTTTENGAGIGSGAYGNAGSITVNGGKFKHTSTNGAGIGSGYYGNAGNITMKCTSIEGTSGYSAVVGTGYIGTCGNLDVDAVSIAAKTSSGVSIGAGDYGTCKNVLVTADNITTAGNGGRGIGAGNHSNCGNISIGAVYSFDAASYHYNFGSTYGNVLESYLYKRDLKVSGGRNVVDYYGSDVASYFNTTLGQGGIILCTTKPDVLTISNKNPNTPTKEYIITSPEKRTVNLILKDVNMKPERDSISPLTVKGLSTLNLVISGRNTLDASSITNQLAPALHVDYGATLICDGDSSAILLLKAGERGAALGERGISSYDYDDDGSKSTDQGYIIINGGQIDARGDAGAGIGGSINSKYRLRHITINGGTVSASSTGGAGIGSGGGYGTGPFELTINGGRVTATSVYGAGIGSGRLYQYENYGYLNILNINGGTISAASSYGEAIGRGRYSYMHISTVEIKGGNISTTPMATDIYSSGVTHKLFTARIQGQANKLVSDLNITARPTDIHYGTKDVYTSSSGEIYMYRPAGKLSEIHRIAAMVENRIFADTTIRDASSSTFRADLYSVNTSLSLNPGGHIVVVNPRESVLVIAAYDQSGKLIEVKFNDITFTTNFYERVNLPTGTKVKAMLWDSVEFQRPICPYLEFAAL